MIRPRLLVAQYLARYGYQQMDALAQRREGGGVQHSDCSVASVVGCTFCGIRTEQQTLEYEAPWSLAPLEPCILLCLMV